MSKYSLTPFLPLSLYLSCTPPHTDVEYMPDGVITTLHIVSDLILKLVRTLSCSEIRMCPTINCLREKPRWRHR